LHYHTVYVLALEVKLLVSVPFSLFFKKKLQFVKASISRYKVRHEGHVDLVNSEIRHSEIS